MIDIRSTANPVRPAAMNAHVGDGTKIGVGRRALIFGGVSAAAAVGLELVSPSPAVAAESGWRWCRQCSALWRPGRLERSCPGSGYGHSAGDWNYVLKVEVDGSPGQPEWRQCAFCQALWWRGKGVTGRCAGMPYGHNEVGNGLISQRYLLETANNNSGGKGQLNWKYCGNCQELVWNPTGTNQVGRCPYFSGAPHQTSNSWPYRLQYL